MINKEFDEMDKRLEKLSLNNFSKINLIFCNYPF